LVEQQVGRGTLSSRLVICSFRASGSSRTVRPPTRAHITLSFSPLQSRTRQIRGPVDCLVHEPHARHTHRSSAESTTLPCAPWRTAPPMKLRLHSHNPQRTSTSRYVSWTLLGSVGSPGIGDFESLPPSTIWHLYTALLLAVLDFPIIRIRPRHTSHRRARGRAHVKI
jgi:hypothetical protein